MATIKVNLASNEGKNIKMNVKLKWTVLQLKEHLYNYNYFQHTPFNQIISLHGTDLENTQTFQEIYDVLTNRGSTDILRSLRGKLTWDPEESHNINIDEIINENEDDDEDAKQSQLVTTPSITVHEISLYIRAKRAPKRILATLTSDEPVIQDFIAEQHRESIVTIKTPSDSDASPTDSSSSSSRGYRARRFDPDAMRKKQERKALKRLRQVASDDVKQETETETKTQHAPLLHQPMGSVVFHEIDEEESSTASSSSGSEPDLNISQDEAKRHRKQRSLFADISGKVLSGRNDADIDDDIDDDIESEEENEAELTQENLYMHTTGNAPFHRKGSSRISSIGSTDWGGGPFIVRRSPSIASSSCLPSNLGLYHAANSSSYIWEFDLPDYYADIPDSLQRIHKKSSRKIDIIEPVDELRELHNDDVGDVEIPPDAEKRSVQFSEHIVYDEVEVDMKEEKGKEKGLDVENVNKWQIKEVGVDSKYIAGMERLNKEEDEEEEAEEDIDTDTDTDSSTSHSTSRSNGIYDEVVVKEDKLQREIMWKTSYCGIWLIGMVWFAAFHCLYSFSAIVNTIVSTLNVKLFDFGLLYFFNFIGVGIGLFVSSYLLSKREWIDSSQKVSKHSIFIVFVCQLIAMIVFVYQYVSQYVLTAWLWFILVFSRFIMGIAIGFVESAVNNLVFEWFSDNAFNAKLSSLSSDSDINKEYLARLSSRVLSYCMFLKEFGHISARLCLVPLIYIFTWNDDNTNLFVALSFGVVVSGLAWIGMMYASIRDNKYKNSSLFPHKKAQEYMILNEDAASDDDSESTPLLGGSDRKRISVPVNIPEDWSYADWYQMGLVGLNRSVILSISFLSINFGISFAFTILSIADLCGQYLYSDFTANLLICCIPITTLFGSNWLRRHILSKINSIWTVMLIGCCLFAIVFALFAFSGLYTPNDSAATLLPILCVILFILGSECAFASGYELLLSSAPEYIHGLISGLNSTTNFIVSGVFILIFGVLVFDYSSTDINVVLEYRWAYAFLCFASIVNLVIAITLRHSFGANVHALQNVQSISP